MNRIHRHLIILLCCVGYFASARGSERDELRAAMRSAAEEMKQVITICRVAHINIVGPIDADRDPNFTGLVGPDESPIVSTFGQLAAKRTALVPDFAALVTRWLAESGVREGDKVAILATGSLPGFNIASICAVRALHATPILQVSVASSEWGLTEPNFTVLDVDAMIRRKIADWPVIDVVSYGAGSDRGHDLGPSGKRIIDKVFRRYQVTPMEGKSLADQQKLRWKKLEQQGPIRAAIVVGGNIAALGSDATRRAGTGLLPPDANLNRKNAGLLGEFMQSKIPVIYLHLAELLAQRWDVPFDPTPLPEPGSCRKIYDF